MAPTRCKRQRSRLLRWWYCTDCGTRVAKKWTYCPACGVILHLPRPQSDDSASGNDAASEGYDEQASGHGGGEIASRGSRHSSTIPGEGGRKDAIEAWRPARGTSEDSRGRSRSRRSVEGELVNCWSEVLSRIVPYSSESWKYSAHGTVLYRIQFRNSLPTP